MQGERAAYATIWADRVRLGLLRLIPSTSLTQLVLTTEHQSTSGTDANTIATIHAGGIRKRCRKLGRNASVETTASHSNSKGILRIGPAGFHAFVTKDAAGIVANVQVIINLHRLCDGGRSGSIRLMMMASMTMISLSACGSRDQTAQDGHRTVACSLSPTAQSKGLLTRQETPRPDGD